MKFKIEMIHTITVRQTHEIDADDLEQAEGIAASRWKRFPTTKQERDNCIVGSVTFDSNPEIPRPDLEAFQREVALAATRDLLDGIGEMYRDCS